MTEDRQFRSRLVASGKKRRGIARLRLAHGIDGRTVGGEIGVGQITLRSNSTTRSPMNTRVESFHELEVYHEVCALDLAIFQVTKTWPKEEMYSLTDQIRRSSRSVGANIAEAWAKRRYPAHFTSKLTDADGELQETQHWLMRSHAYGYLPQQNFDALWQQAQQAGRRLGSMMKSGNWS